MRMQGWSRILGVPSNQSGQDEVGSGEVIGELTHETHQTAPSCLDHDVNAQSTCLKGKSVVYPRSVSVNL